MHADYFTATEKLAKLLAESNITVVYGGSAIGLMGHLATTALQHGGHVVGIMPNFMRDVEWAHKDVKEFHFVGDMHERKKKFLEQTDALIALPGGTGTLEELLKAITLKRLGLYTKPIIILNTNNYYAPLLAMFDRCIEEKFMDERNRNIWTVVSEPGEILPAIKAAPAWGEDAIHYAVMK